MLESHITRILKLILGIGFLVAVGFHIGNPTSSLGAVNAQTVPTVAPTTEVPPTEEPEPQPTDTVVPPSAPSATITGTATQPPSVTPEVLASATPRAASPVTVTPTASEAASATPTLTAAPQSSGPTIPFAWAVVAGLGLLALLLVVWRVTRRGSQL